MLVKLWWVREDKKKKENWLIWEVDAPSWNLLQLKSIVQQLAEKEATTGQMEDLLNSSSYSK